MDCKEIIFDSNKVILKDVENFNIKQTFECGQCFRWKKSDIGYIGIAFGRVIELEQKENDIIIHNTNEEDFKNLWIKYFDLKRDYSAIKKELAQDEILKKSVDYGYGIRILNQEPFEILISFIISARNSIPVISKTINKISEKWGTPLEYKGATYYAFPTVDQLKDVTEEEIRSTGASFRSKYIYDTIQKVYKCKENVEGYDEFDLQKIKSLNDDECHTALQKFSGVGAKVADCIMLFSMEKYSAFPVDVWVKRAMGYFYGVPDVSLSKIRIFAREKFGEVSGFAQQYLFYYARENKINI